MKKYAIVENGIIIQTIICRQDELKHYSGEIIECPEYVDCSYYYKDGFVQLPQKPYGYFEFDVESEQWITTVSEAKQKEVTQLQIRNKRNKLLADSDWTQVADSPLSDEQKAAWSAYRQELRDLPYTYANELSINNVQFPAAPN